MVLKFGGSKSHQHDCLSILGPNGQRKYAPKSFSTIGPSNANFVIASATSHDAASASILSFAELYWKDNKTADHALMLWSSTKSYGLLHHISCAEIIIIMI
jgi:hypothetical protein